MLRLRKYASTTVPVIGCDMANSRRADSADPVGTDDARSLAPIIGLGRGSSRKRLASSTTSRKSARRQLSRMTSIRSPWSPVAASVHLPAAPFPDSAPFRRTKRERPGVFLNIADQPVAAFSASVREIAATHRLGILRETARQFRRLLRHGGCPQTKRARRRRRAPEGGDAAPLVIQPRSCGSRPRRVHLRPVARPRPWPFRRRSTPSLRRSIDRRIPTVRWSRSR